MDFHHRPRRLLPDTPAPPSSGGRVANFDTNMVIILAALLCALICALGINSIARCVLRCAAGMGSGESPPRRFGGGRRGLKKAALRRIPVAVYASSGEGGSFTDCPICLGEFVDGEKMRVLPKCHHCFHVNWFDVWLASHSSCPTCRRCVAEEEVVESGGEAVVGGGGWRPENVSGGDGDGTTASASGSAEDVG